MEIKLSILTISSIEVNTIGPLHWNVVFCGKICRCGCERKLVVLNVLAKSNISPSLRLSAVLQFLGNDISLHNAVSTSIRHRHVLLLRS